MLTKAAQDHHLEPLQNLLKELSPEGLALVLSYAQSVLEDEQDTRNLVSGALKLSEPSLARAWNDQPDEP